MFLPSRISQSDLGIFFFVVTVMSLSCHLMLCWATFYPDPRWYRGYLLSLWPVCFSPFPAKSPSSITLAVPRNLMWKLWFSSSRNFLGQVLQLMVNECLLFLLLRSRGLIACFSYCWRQLPGSLPQFPGPSIQRFLLQIPLTSHSQVICQKSPGVPGCKLTHLLLQCQFLLRPVIPEWMEMKAIVTLVHLPTCLLLAILSTQCCH
jgi:hypothetical protein